MAEKMKDPVDQAEGEFLRRTLAESPGLLDGPLHGNGHVSQKTGRLFPPLPLGRKRHHIGGPIPFQPAIVQSPDPGVVREKQAQLPRGSALLAENESGQVTDRPTVEGALPLLVPDLDPGHRELKVISD